MHKPTKKDLAKFEELFGFAPSFTTADRFQDSGARREWGASQAVNDWCYFPDCDEQTTWDLPIILALTEEHDMINYTFVHTHDENGGPGQELVNSKLYDTTKCKWVGMIHEVVVRDASIRAVYTDKMRVDHWQRMDRQHRMNYIKHIEYAAIREPSPRNCYYLGREYMNRGFEEQALAVFMYMVNLLPAWNAERAQAYMYMAELCKNKEPGRSVAYYHAALMDDDTRREPWVGLGVLHLERGEYRSAAAYLEAALSIPHEPGFMSNTMIYGPWLHARLAEAYKGLGNRNAERRHRRRA